LESRIQAESQKRQTAVNTVIKEVTSELDKRATTPPPSSTENYRIYTVEKGDTLGAIAKAFNLTINQLKAINELSNDIIIVGQKLKIPMSP
jgi:LysM repeat protein